MNTASITSELRVLLNEWNPIGHHDIPEDEYDCLLAPLLSRLEAGAGQAEIGEFLRHELTEHFGLPEKNRDDVADRLVIWWKTRYLH